MKSEHFATGGAGITPASSDHYLPVVVNAGNDAIHRHFRLASMLDVAWLNDAEPHDRTAAIIAGGPSAGDHLDKIRQLAKDKNCDLYAVNGSIKWLNKMGIVPDFAVMLDARAENTVFVKGSKARKYLISAQCHPAIFEAIPAKKTVLWWPHYEDVAQYIDRRTPLIGGGTTVGLQSISIAHCLGYRETHLFGFDSSYRGDEDHAYKQPIPNEKPPSKFAIRGRAFMCEPWMVRQATEFQGVVMQMIDAGASLYVHGDGLLPEVFKSMTTPKETMTAVYDLAVSPPTYNFFDFLLSAEKMRVERGFKDIDLIFQPGPNHGFRDDNLPPGPKEREMMLWRICVAGARCLPSIRNISVLKERREVHGAMFPENWTESAPANYYGFDKIAEGVPMALKGKYGNPFPGEHYITITLREAPYWSERNSDRRIWAKVARELAKRGNKVVVVPDAFSPWDGTHFYEKDGVTFFPTAALDLDIRISLYQHAVCNLFYANGVVEAARLSGAPHLVFCPLNENSMATTTDFFKMVGVTPGDQFPYHGRVLWDVKEDADEILEAFHDWMVTGTSAYATSQKGN